MEFGTKVGGIDVFLPVLSFPHVGATAEAILPNSPHTATLTSSRWIGMVAVDTQ